MYSIAENSIIKINSKSLVKLGSIVDGRVNQIEQLVAKHFSTTVHELDYFYKDSPAKLMCCFLLHDVLQYSIGSIALKYKIHKQYLQNTIKEYYIKALKDEAFFNTVTGLKDAFLDLKVPKQLTH